MSELSQNETTGAPDLDSGHGHRHRRKRRTRKKLYRRIIIVLISLGICGGAFFAWHYLVQEPPPRSGMAEMGSNRA